MILRNTGTIEPVLFLTTLHVTTPTALVANRFRASALNSLSKRPHVSTIIVNWNRRTLLKEALEAVRGQDYPSTLVEIVVVDNGSTDGSAEMVSREFPRARLIRNGQNRGFCAANNQGIQAASPESRYIVLLNNDATPESGWLSALVEVAETHPGAGMVASKIVVYEDPSRIDKVGHLLYLDGQNRGRGTGQIDRGQFDQVEEILWPDGCAALYRREMLEEIGGFDEDLFAYGDDADLGFRARVAGWRCWYSPRAVVRHHRGATLGLQSSRRIELIERNRVLLAAKLFPWSLLWLNGIFYLARIAAGVWAAMMGRGETALYPGIQGKLRIALALAWGGLQAIPLLPGTFNKRRCLIRRLTPRQIVQLILRHRISLRELSQQSTLP
ncbi:MAG: glycosyltransferase family 2 protein [Bryobacteraceae bacterium]